MIFVGTFTAGRLKGAVEDGRLVIREEGRSRKFVEQVEHRTFSGEYALKRRQPVLYVTERCVLRLTPDGMELKEVAPGIDIERDILAHMEFEPIIGRPALMEESIFNSGPMGLRERMLAIPLENRFSYDPSLNVLFINFERLRVRSERDVARIRAEVEKRVAPLGRKVYAIVNYTNCVIEPGVFESYSQMVKGLVDACYLDVTRYGTSGFLRMKLGDALHGRGLAPHIYESAEEAEHSLRPLKTGL